MRCFFKHERVSQKAIFLYILNNYPNSNVYFAKLVLNLNFMEKEIGSNYLTPTVTSFLCLPARPPQLLNEC